MKAMTLSICAAAALAAPTSADAQSISPQTRWANNHGSELVIQSIGADGRLAGTYSQDVPGYACRGVAFPIVGWVDGDRISYTMRARNESVNCEFITSWTGFVQNGQLYAEWSVVQWNAEAGRQWLTRGTDVYRPK
ncbi:MAG: avidin/streptavidin family protein [Alphaproteobacteria bacterium]|jgi:hypothetical protein